QAARSLVARPERRGDRQPVPDGQACGQPTSGRLLPGVRLPLCPRTAHPPHSCLSGTNQGGRHPGRLLQRPGEVSGIATGAGGSKGRKLPGPGGGQDPLKIILRAGEPPSEPHFRVARQRLGATTACRHEQEEEPSRNTRKHLATGQATCSIITRPWHHGPLSMVDLGRVDAIIPTGDGVRLKSQPDTTVPRLMTPTTKVLLEGRGFFFSSHQPSEEPCSPEGFFHGLNHSSRGEQGDLRARGKGGGDGLSLGH